MPSTEVFPIRLTKAEIDFVIERAEKMGIAKTQLVQFIVKKELAIMQKLPPPPPPVPKEPAPSAPPPTSPKHTGWWRRYQLEMQNE